MTVLSGRLPMLRSKSVGGRGERGGGPAPSKAALCKTNLSIQKETLSFHSRSQNVKMLGLLSGRQSERAGGDQKAKATRRNTAIFRGQRDFRLFTANLQNGCTIKYLIKISASFSLPLCGGAQALSTSHSEGRPCTDGLPSL